MDTSLDLRSDPRFTAREHGPHQGTLPYEVEILGALESRVGDGEGWRLVDVVLTGGAPWGFSLKGGLEHREPLIITKVEEGSKASAIRLQVGDEIVTVNEIPLSGYRQEAICLVKGSHKTLTLGVRRRNVPVNRPHSWHSIKFAEGQSEAVQTQTTPTVVSKSRYDASSSSNDLSSGWDQTNLWRVSDQFSSLGSMDSLEQSPHPYPPGRLSPAKSSNSADHLGGAKRDSAYSSFSTGSGTPDHTLSRSNATSTENMMYKVGVWDSRRGQSPDDRQGAGGGGGGRDSPRHSAGRASIGPVWHVPEKKRATPPSPPPPLPPARSDSFAVTKVHEKGAGVAYTAGPDPYTEQRPLGRGENIEAPNNAPWGHQINNRGPDIRRSYNPPPKNDPFYPCTTSSDSYNISNSQLNSNRLYSLSSTDVRSGHSSHFDAPHHQRQYSDESTFYQTQPRVASMATVTTTAPKQPSVGGYYSSMQELPTNNLHQLNSQGHARTSTASLSTNLGPDPGQSRYYCITPRQAASVKVDRWKGGTGSSAGVGTNDQSSLSSSKAHKAKYRIPEPQRPYPKDKGSNGYYKRGDQPLDRPAPNPNTDERGRQGRDNGYHAESHYVNYPLGKHEEEKRAFQPREAPQGGVCPQTTPLLHALSQDGFRPPEPPLDPLTGEQVKRNDRYATALRNEIESRRAQLHKSRSAASLTGPGQAEEGEGVVGSPETSASSSDGSFSNTYKDHLKEAQARVLQATSFRRRDLEPEALPSYPPSTPLPAPILHPEALQSKPAPAQVSRIGGRKRFPAEKKVHSFSEPDKIHEVGVAVGPPGPEPTGSLADRRKFFEATGKPAFQRPLPKHVKQRSPEDLRGGGPKGNPYPSEMAARTRGRGSTTGHRPGDLNHTDQQALMEQQQRLGTFAEYEATWNVQRKPPEARPSGRYHSADNILDTGVEERSRPSYIHERSRSSPSADFYGKNAPEPVRKSAEFSKPERKSIGHESVTPRETDGTHSGLGARESPSQPDRVPEPPQEVTLRDDPESLSFNPGFPRHQHRRPLPRDPDAPPPYPDDRTGGSAPLRPPPPPKSDRHGRPETAPSLGDSLEPHAAAPSPRRDSAHSPRRDRRHGAGLEDERRGASHGAALSRPEPPPASPPTSFSSKPTGLLQPPMDGPRSPSPHFNPQRLTDKPPISLHDDAPCRMESLTENGGSSSSTGKKVPIRIVSQPESRLLLPPDEPQVGSGLSQEHHPPPCAYREQWSAGGREAPPTQQASTNGVSPEEEQKREELARDIVGRDKSLADILDQSGMRTTMDLMEGIFPQDGALLDGVQQRRKPTPKQTSPRSAKERGEEESMAAAVGLVTSSSYYSTSVPKAELLIKMKDMQEPDSEDELEIDLADKKHQLIDSLSRKLQVLQEARESLLEDVQENNALGDEVEATVQQACRPNELDKFRMFVGDLDKVVSLLLSLSGRLARVENALNTLEEGAAPEEKRTLTEKRELLIRQHEDAKELKENLDRRERAVSHILANHLSEERLADFQHFVKMKAALIIEQRKLDDKVKLGEEQLKCLTDSLPLDQRPPF